MPGTSQSARNLVQREQRHRQRHAVARAARLEVVGQPHLDPGDVHRLREQLGGHAGRLVPHQLFAVQVQELGVVARGVLVPLLEPGAVHHAGRYLLVVERGDQLVVHQHVEAPRLVFEVLDLPDQLVVVREERRARIVVAAHQRLANEDLARLARVVLRVVDAPLAVHHDAVQRRALGGSHLGLALFPARLAPRFFQQVRADLLDPLRLDLRYAARI
jgi:hypothetical protein